MTEPTLEEMLRNLPAQHRGELVRVCRRALERDGPDAEVRLSAAPRDAFSFDAFERDAPLPPLITYVRRASEVLDLLEAL